MTDTPAALREAHHADVSGGWLRPAVFGAMDGLVTNIALIAGVGGGGVSPRSVVLTGTAGLVAGAISMGLGEYTSVRSANEQVAAEVAKERRELERHPEAEARELADAWVARGLPRDLATQAGRAGVTMQIGHCIRFWPEYQALEKYVQGKRGVVARHDGMFELPDYAAHGGGTVLDPAYSVRFTSRELWGEGGSDGEAVYVDLWERYLEPDP